MTTLAELELELVRKRRAASLVGRYSDVPSVADRPKLERLFTVAEQMILAVASYTEAYSPVVDETHSATTS
jgi:hypothetical protein